MAVPSMHVLGGVALAGGATFDPVTAFTWHSLFWAEGPDMIAQGYTDGASVGTWPNETTEKDATQGTAGFKPLYRAAVTALNSKPGVDFDGADDVMNTASFTSNPTYPLSYVVICAVDALSGTYQDPVNGAGTGRNDIMYNASTSYGLYFRGGNTLGFTTPTTSGHMIRAYAGGTTAPLGMWIDGTLDAWEGSATSTAATALNLGGVYHPFNGKVVFAGIYQGDIAAHASWPDFLSWAGTYYGVTVDTYATPDTPVTGLAPTVWLDASDASTFTLSGSDVIYWKDKSGNTHHFYQGTSGNRPQRTGTMNGLTCVTFDGSNDYVRTRTTLAGALGNSVTMFFVTYGTGTNLDGLFDGAHGSANVFRSIGANWEWWNNSPVLATGHVQNNAAIHCVQTTISGQRKIEKWLNGGTSTSATNAGTTSTTWLELTLGTYNDASGPFAGKLGEVLIFNSALGTTDREAVRDYLNAKWAVY